METFTIAYFKKIADPVIAIIILEIAEKIDR
jgi:hypothetical protein